MSKDICLLQIEFRPLHQYAYVPVPNSHKIESKHSGEVISWLTANGDLVKVVFPSQACLV